MLLLSELIKLISFFGKKVTGRIGRLPLYIRKNKFLFLLKMESDDEFEDMVGFDPLSLPTEKPKQKIKLAPAIPKESKIEEAPKEEKQKEKIEEKEVEKKEEEKKEENIKEDKKEEAKKEEKEERRKSLLVVPERIAKDEFTDEEFHFEILPPNKQPKGNYYIFPIITKTNNEMYGRKRISIGRRYADFDYIRNQLLAENVGLIIPPVPSKNFLSGLEKVLKGIETTQLQHYRQRSLLKFLERVATHPILKKSPMLKSFLTLSYEEYQNFQKLNKVPKSRGSLFKTKVNLPSWIVEKRDYVFAVEEHVRDLRSKLEALIKCRLPSSKCYNDAGKSFRSFGALETKENKKKKYAEHFAKIGNNLEKLSSAIDKQFKTEQIKVVETLSYYMGICDTVRLVCKSLENARITRDGLTSEVKKKTQKIASLKNEAKKAKLEKELEELKEKEEDAKKELINAEKNFKIDSEQFDELKMQDLSLLLQVFVNLQVSFLEESKKSWSRLIIE